MADLDKIITKLPAELTDMVLCGHHLRRATTLQVGGPAKVFCRARTTEQARRFQEMAATAELPCFILGGGSNILADDAGFPGLILRVETDVFQSRGTILTVGAGLEFDALIQRSLQAGLTGLEFASGIPGTVGGAVMGNAGCYGYEIGEFIREAVTLGPDGRLRRRGADEFGFRYRATDLRESGEILLEVVLELEAGDLSTAAAVRQEHLADRARKHPGRLPSAGSWFRNLPPPAPGARRVAAGHLLEQVGAKDFAEGDARVFPKHANMIINTGRATSAQVLRLARRMKRAVRERFDVDLIQEVRYLDPTAPQGLLDEPATR
ncbi:UDP-N-acetylenolpyruvoylglucosamine reductase [bacterium DOLZORAL124_64_63]|nr:MAG: UDP-N-acetylenolpyruvoylglucosamine reductase [bacterium DOLZORAL124_64_63]